MSSNTIPGRTPAGVQWTSGHAGPMKGIRRRTEPVRVTVSTLAFFSFLLLNLTLYLRPAEVVPELEGLQIYQGLILSTFLLAFPGVRKHSTLRALRQQPVFICVLGLWVAVVVSGLTHLWFYDAYQSFTAFFKVVLYFLLFMTTVNTPQRFQVMLFTTAVFGTLMVGLCVIDYLGFVDFRFIVHLVDQDGGENLHGDLLTVVRMRGTGIFQDPNDLAMMIIAAGVMWSFFLTRREWGWQRFLCLLPMLLLLLALVLTRSRGGLLAGGIAGLTLVATRYGRKVTIIIGILGAMALPLVAGRQGNIDMGEGGTGHERVLMWREGFAEVLGQQIAFGIGHNMYSEIAGLVAHNSFIHTYVELGLFGGTLFYGCFFFTGLAMYRMTLPGMQITDLELKRAGPYIGALLAGWCGSMFSLSRCYIEPTYMIIAIGAVYTNLVCLSLTRPQLLVYWDSRHLKLLIWSSLGFFTFLYLFVRFVA